MVSFSSLASCYLPDALVQGRHIDEQRSNKMILSHTEPTTNERSRHLILLAFLSLFSLPAQPFSSVLQFPLTRQYSSSDSHRRRIDIRLHAAPKRLKENAEGSLYVNDRVSIFHSAICTTFLFHNACGHHVASLPDSALTAQPVPILPRHYSNETNLSTNMSCTINHPFHAEMNWNRLVPLWLHVLSRQYV